MLDVWGQAMHTVAGKAIAQGGGKVALTFRA